MTNLLLTALMLLSSWHATGTEHTITWYWPGEDNWGNAVADPSIMVIGDPGVVSWTYPWVAVNDLRTYPFGTVLFIEGIGLKVVRDHCPQWDTIDIRVPERHMDKRRARVWVIWRQQ